MDTGNNGVGPQSSSGAHSPYDVVRLRAVEIHEVDARTGNEGGHRLEEKRGVVVPLPFRVQPWFRVWGLSRATTIIASINPRASETHYTQKRIDAGRVEGFHRQIRP